MLRFDRRLLSHFEWPLLLTMLAVVACGLMTILSATHSTDRLLSPYLMRQLIWVGIGFVGLLIALSFDYHWLERYGYFLYAGIVGLLIFTAMAGETGGGARRWIALGPISIQPSEFAKLPLVVIMSCCLHRQVSESTLSLRALILPCILLALPVLLVLRQPDLGTAIVLAITAGSVVMVAGLSFRLIGLVALAAAPLLPAIWRSLETYQQNRILTFLDPQSDPLGTGYHVIQSMIAIGSGKFYGKGYLQGTQNQLNFLPEQHTDFIFSVFAEEWGFVGASLLIVLYAALLIRCFVIASRAKDAFGVLLSFGLSVMIVTQVIVNMAMAMGALPVVGITLPFVSYGGSSLLVCMVAIGLLMNVSMRRFTF